MLLGKLSLLLVLHIIGIGMLLNWFRFKTKFRLLIFVYIYYFAFYVGAAYIMRNYPVIWDPIEAGIVNPKKINPAYK